MRWELECNRSIRCACLPVCPVSKVIRIHVLRQLMHIDFSVKTIHSGNSITARLHFNPLIYWTFLSSSHNYTYLVLLYMRVPLCPPFSFCVYFLLFLFSICREYLLIYRIREFQSPKMHPNSFFISTIFHFLFSFYLFLFYCVIISVNVVLIRFFYFFLRFLSALKIRDAPCMKHIVNIKLVVLWAFGSFFSLCSGWWNLRCTLKIRSNIIETFNIHFASKKIRFHASRINTCSIVRKSNIWFTWSI